MKRYNMAMAKKEAIKKMGCEDRKCEYLDPNGPYTFCRALRTKDFCQERDKKDVNDR